VLARREKKVLRAMQNLVRGPEGEIIMAWLTESFNETVRALLIEMGEPHRAVLRGEARQLQELIESLKDAPDTLHNMRDAQPDPRKPSGSGETF